MSITVQHTIWCDGVIDGAVTCANWIMESGKAGDVLKIAKNRRWRRVRIAHSSLDLCPECGQRYIARGLIKAIPEQPESKPVVETIGVFQLMERLKEKE